MTGLLTGHVTPEDFFEHRFTDPLRQRLTAATTIDAYELPLGDSGDIGPSNPETITVTLTDGTVLTQDMLDVPGGAAMPMTQEQLMRKVADCGCSVEQAKAFLAEDGKTLVADTGLLDQQPAGDEV